jgi:hypothetical protein
MTVQECAKVFIKKYDVQKLTYSKLEEIIEELGYKVKKFDIYNKRSIEFLDNLSLLKQIEHSKCFIYSCKNLKLIFISGSLNSKEIKTLLLHEIGHIMLNHIFNTNGLISENITYEIEANEFVYLVQEQLKKRKVLQSVINSLFYTLILTACVTSLLIGYKLISSSSDSDQYTSYNNSNSIVSQIQTTTIESVTTLSKKTTSTLKTNTLQTTTTPDTSEITIQSSQQQNNENIYYITKSGTKYHLSTCYHIVGRAATSATKEELENAGYSPCTDCLTL